MLQYQHKLRFYNLRLVFGSPTTILCQSATELSVFVFCLIIHSTHETLQSISKQEGEASMLDKLLKIFSISKLCGFAANMLSSILSSLTHRGLAFKQLNN